MTPLRRRLWLLGLACLAVSARADTLVLAGGKTLTRVRVLAIGPEQVAILTAKQEVVFCARDEVLQLVDERGQARGFDDATDRDPAAVITQLVNDGVRIRPPKGDATEAVEQQSVLRIDDELWTGPYGRVTLRGRGGEVFRVRDDAVLRGEAQGLRLKAGTLRLEKPSGTASALVLGGDVEVRDGAAAIEVRTTAVRVTTLKGHAVYTGQAGFRVELPRNHALDVVNVAPGEPVAVIASNANAWPVRLQVGERWLTVEPGERTVLVGTEQPLPPEAAAGEGSGNAVARVIRVLSGFQLRREGQSRHVSPTAAEGLELQRGDRLQTLDGTVWIEEGSSRLEVFARTELTALTDEEGPSMGLVGGEAHVSGREVLLGLPWGEARVRGASLFRVRGKQLLVSTNDGVAATTLSAGVRLRVPMESSATAIRGADATEWTVRAQPGSAALQVTHDQLELTISDGAQARCVRVDGYAVTEVHGARLELDQQVGAKVAREPGRANPVLTLADGRRYPVVPGTYRIARHGNQYRVQALPTGVEQDPVGGVLEPVVKAPPQGSGTEQPSETQEQPRPPVEPPTPPPGRTEAKLGNGAVLTGKDWGDFEVKRQVGDMVEVAGPGGILWVGPEVRATLGRNPGGGARLQIADGRKLTTSANGPAITTRLEADGWMRVEVVDPGGKRRAVAVEPGCDFELVVIDDDYVAAYIFGQLKYVEAGQSLTVSGNGGMKTTQLP